MHYYLTAIHADDTDDVELMPIKPPKGDVTASIPVTSSEFKDLVTMDFGVQ